MTTLYFVVDGRALEAQATLLAATLVARNAQRYPCIAYVADRHRAALTTAARDLFDRCGVTLRALPVPPRNWRTPYPHGNKILAAADPRSGDYSLFLDTDMICTAPLDLDSLQSPGHVAVVPEGVPSWGRDGDRWARAYAHFGLPLPEDRVQLTRRRRINFLPYFNAGFILMPEAEVLVGRRFGLLWLETALEVDWHVSVARKRPWLDQITLPLTLKRFGLDYRVAPVDYNYSVSDRAYDAAAAPRMMHYHRLAYLHGWPHRQVAFADLAAMAGPALMARLEAEFGDLYHATELPVAGP